MKHTMVRVLRPDFQSQVRHGSKMVRNTPTLGDYIEVPRLSTFGTWQIVETLPTETLSKLYIMQKHLTGVKTHG